MAVTDIELDVELLKKEVSDMKEIHGRLDTAITKITDVSNCINRMLAVHEEKISQQEEVQIRDAQTFANDVKELHSRICLLYTSPSPRDRSLSRMPSSA